ncbi:helix-turn-helix transcriptional regulator [Pelotalea chapellei]|uniref:WYL domain-containing protein n=1 Tax=Pelotalea chapellei TaxID=44671 RepID=A0ABS5U4V5_9BACT|nr:WYL domain-containing protein [Pelotalea chapellei]MBT1070674.1 WYL domain-containing protein [Pelotalea chapellei]
MSAIYRQWLILKMFPQRGKLSTTVIHERLKNEFGIDTSLRTIQRDLVSLELNEFPLDCDNENPAGWSWRKDAPAFGISNMDPVAALTFKLAEKYLERMFPRGAIGALEPYFRAANERIKMISESSFSRWPDKIRTVTRSMPMISPHIAEDLLEKVYTAVLEEQRFTTSYRTAEGSIKEYDVNPLGMAFVEGVTYLIATLNKHKDPILLLLHRFLEVKPTNIPITIPEGFNLDEYIKELSFPVGDNIKLKAFFFKKDDVERLRESPIATDQRLTEKKDGWLLQANVSDSYQLRWWLRGYGERVEVIAPKSLRAEFIHMTQGLSNLYCKSPCKRS